MLRTTAFVATLALAVGCVFASCTSNPGTTGSSPEPIPASSNATPTESQTDSGSDSGTKETNTPPRPAEPGAQGGEADDAGSDAGSGGSSDGGSGPAVEFHPDDGVLQVWTLGDSITVGVDGGFRNDLYNLLADDGLDVDMVGTQHDESTEIADKDHEGHVAFTIENTLDEVDSWLAQITPPDVVVLWLGCNDFAWWTNIMPSDHADQYDKLVKHLLDVLPPKAVIVIGSIPPQSSEIIESVELDRTQMTDDFDDILRVRVPKYPGYGQRVFFADVRAIVSLDDLYDGIHPTRETHARIGELFYDVMHENLGL